MQVPLAPERPIDLFKAIFEADVDDDDGSEDDAEEPATTSVHEAEPSGRTASVSHAASGDARPAVPGAPMQLH